MMLINCYLKILKNQRTTKYHYQRVKKLEGIEIPVIHCLPNPNQSPQRSRPRTITARWSNDGDHDLIMRTQDFTFQMFTTAQNI